MSHTSNTLLECPTIQDKLNDHFTSCDPTTIREPIPFLEFLVSPTNTRGILQNQIAPGNGKIRNIDLVYEPRLHENEAATTSIQSCSSGAEGGQRHENYNLDVAVGTSIPMKFKLTSLAEICEADELYIARQLQKMMDAAIRKMATTTMSQVPALKGNFGPNVATVNGSNELVVATKKSGGDIDTNFIEQISFAALDTAYCSVPYIFGYDEIHKAFKRVKAGCCATDGLNVGEFARNEGMVFMTDYRVADTFGENHFISVGAGALQLLTYNEFVGPRGLRVIDTEDYKQTVITDPATGIKFDMTWKFDCGDIYVQLKLAHKLVGMPHDMFFVDDRLENVTFVNEYLITNP